MVDSSRIRAKEALAVLVAMPPEALETPPVPINWRRGRASNNDDVPSVFRNRPPDCNASAVERYAKDD